MDVCLEQGAVIRAVYWSKDNGSFIVNKYFFFYSFAHPGPAQHLFNLFILWLHQHGELQVLDGVLVSAEHLLQHEQKH